MPTTPFSNLGLEGLLTQDPSGTPPVDEPAATAEAAPKDSAGSDAPPPDVAELIGPEALAEIMKDAQAAIEDMAVLPFEIIGHATNNRAWLDASKERQERMGRAVWQVLMTSEALARVLADPRKLALAMVLAQYAGTARLAMSMPRVPITEKQNDDGKGVA